ncbi:MAG: hypothetical protein GC190_00480 [Alphaproteobacteria bacterium]|nr:hypothetical protein [Alphaproteobacteria bacterium]
MNKIPVIGTVSRAFGFLIGDFVTILRLVWAPLLGAALVQYYVGGEIMDAALKTAQSADPTRMMAYLPQNFLMGIVEFLASIIAMVALLRVVISGDRKPGLFVYLWFGSAELRLVAVYILLFIGAIAAIVGVGIVLGILGAIASQIPALVVLLGVAAVVLFVVVLWVVLRLSLIAPVIVAESGLGVERSWALMRGNALRMFAIILLVFIPVAIVGLIGGMFILGADFPPFTDILTLMKAGAKEQLGEAMKHWQTQLMTAYTKHWLELNVAGFFYNVVSTALFAGVAGSAYLAASGKHE